MSLQIGQQLGYYKITSLIGQGGMGEVYRATDVRLDRTVALKVLTQHLADDRQGRERFEREARAAGSLNHPHICALYDVGEQAGLHYLVMEYIEGETLQKRLEAGPLTMKAVFEYGLQIADALDKTHTEGIVHRDLKPGNIMITKTGVKLLDFGLAKLRMPPAPPSPSESPTQGRSSPVTMEGTILGTLQYMAPEQLEGKEADARTDVFAFGAILYEMVTGKRAFDGGSPASVIGAILKDSPQPLSNLRPVAPPALDRFVAVCLEKDPEKRWQTMRDLRREFKWMADGGALPPEAPQTIGPRSRFALAPWTVAVLFALVSAALTLQLYRQASVSAPLTRLSVELPAEHPFRGIGSPGRGLAVSPDGRMIVYVSGSAGRRQLYSRALDQTSVAPIAGTEGSLQPFFSPDGKWLAFFTQTGELKKVSLERGGAAVTLVKGLLNGQWCFGEWGKDNVIVFSAFENLLEVSADGGAPTPLTRLDSAAGESYHQFPQIVPGTGDVLFTVGFNSGGTRVDLIRKNTGQRSTVLEDAAGAVITPSGRLVFNRDDVLLAVAFDAAQGRITGRTVPLSESVITDAGAFGDFENPQLAVSNNGTLAYIPVNPDAPDPAIGWISFSGEFSPLGMLPKNFNFGDLSPDGNTAVVGAGSRVFLFDLLRSVTTPINLGRRQTETASWYPDGKRITLGGPYLSLYDIDSRKETVLTEAGRPKRFPSWSPDGKTVVYNAFNPNNDVYMLTPAEPNAKPRAFLATAAVEANPAISPDGRLVAYRSSGADESARLDVYVARFPEGTGAVQVTNGGGGAPFWSRDSRSLFFGAPPGVLRTAAISIGNSIQVGSPKTLFELKDFTMIGASPDGRRLLGVRTPPSDPPRTIVVVQNWTDELEHLLASN